MPSTYCPYEFRILSGHSSLSEMVVRVHAPSRDEAWRRVVQMHPRAHEVKAHEAGQREESHNFSSAIANFAN